jgi:hypothetical protein
VEDPHRQHHRPDHPNDILRDCYELGIAERCSSFTATEPGIVNKLNFGNRNSGFARQKATTWRSATRSKPAGAG